MSTPEEKSSLAKVVRVPVELNRPYAFIVCCPFDQTCDGFEDGQPVTFLKGKIQGDATDIEVVQSQRQRKCSDSCEWGVKFRLSGNEPRLGIKAFSIQITYTVSNRLKVYAQTVNFFIRVFTSEMLHHDPDLKVLFKTANLLTYLSPVQVVVCPKRCKKEDPSSRVDDKLSDLIKQLSLHEGGIQYVNQATKGSLIKWNLLKDLTPENYVIKYEAMNCYERRQQGFDIRLLSIQDTSFRQDGKFYILDIDQCSFDRNDIREGDNIVAYSKESHSETRGFIAEVDNSEIVVKFPNKFNYIWGPKVRFSVRFVLNKFVFDKSSEILLKIGVDMKTSGSVWRKFLFPCLNDVRDHPIISHQFRMADAGLNSSQQEAVRRILNGGGIGVPYIIFGPPGTGKTKTLVEAIIQTYKNSYKSILVTASSNASADELAIRLIRHYPNNVARIYARSRRPEQIPLELTGHIAVPGKIIVCTFVAARQFLKAKLPRRIQFHDLFMDEVGHASELTALCSIEGLVSPMNGRVVMAGDPYQLGPVVKSRVSVEHGMEISLLERLMEREIYQPNPKTKTYDNRVITKLTLNYRSHVDLLHVPNALFYDEDLVACASPDVQKAFLGWSELPQSDFPLIFKGIVGQEARDEKGLSFFNLEEALTVCDYLAKVARKLGPSGDSGKDIAVLTPYRGQINKIRSILTADKTRFHDLTIGSTEELQGKEKKVVIISTVRSQPVLADKNFEFKIGFLNNPKRFNVAVTRAQSLLIIVGNPLVLKEDPNWRSLLEFIIDRGGYSGYCSDTIRKKISSMT